MTVSSGRVRRAGILLLALLAVWWAVGLAAALTATAPHPAAIPAPPRLDGAVVEPVETTARDGVRVRGWLAAAAGNPPRCVVLAAGVRGNRLVMLERGRWYVQHGWSALLVDLRGTGASDPVRISMGWHEALDLCAWHAFLRARGVAAIGVHGQSLGAAAAVYTAVRGAPAPDWAFAVLESCYTDVTAALGARLPLIPAGLLWPLVASAEWLVEAEAGELAPAVAIARLTAPTLLVCGARDDQCGPDAIPRLLAASGARDKQHLVVAGAGHVDLWRADGDAFRRALEAFLSAR